MNQLTESNTVSLQTLTFALAGPATTQQEQQKTTYMLYAITLCLLTWCDTGCAIFLCSKKTFFLILVLNLTWAMGTLAAPALLPGVGVIFQCRSVPPIVPAMLSKVIKS